MKYALTNITNLGSNAKVKATLCKKIASSINKSANFVIKII